MLQAFNFTNDYDGFHLLTQKLELFRFDEIIIGLESTAHYGNNLVEFLMKRKYKVCVINPIQINTMCKNNIRKTKTRFFNPSKVLAFSVLDPAVYHQVTLMSVTPRCLKEALVPSGMP